MSIRYIHSEVVNSISKYIKENFVEYANFSDYAPYSSEEYDDMTLLVMSTAALSDIAGYSFTKIYDDSMRIDFYIHKIARTFARIKIFFEHNYTDSNWHFPLESIAIEYLERYHESLIFADDNKKSLFFIAFANRELCDAIRYSITEGKQSNEVEQSLRYALQYILFWWSIFAMSDPVKEAA